jgi:hypothetical protein
MKGLGFALEIKLALNKERVQLPRLRSVKGIWLTNFDFGVIRRGSASVIMHKVIDGFG